MATKYYKVEIVETYEKVRVVYVAANEGGNPNLTEECILIAAEEGDFDYAAKDALQTELVDQYIDLFTIDPSNIPSGVTIVHVADTEET